MLRIPPCCPMITHTIVSCWIQSQNQNYKFQKFAKNSNFAILQNKENLRDLIAATGLMILTQIGFKSYIFQTLWPWNLMDDLEKQGKSEGFESCDRPIVRKRPIWVKIGDVLSHVTLKFDGWPWKTIGHLFFAVSSFVQHFIAIGEFKLELQSGNAQFESNSTIFRFKWPWNLTDDRQKRKGTSSMLLQALCIIS